MHIFWLGQTCVKLQTKNIDEDVTVLIDPYKPQKGDFPRSFTPQLALYSRGTQKSATLSQDPFIMDTLGEIEVKGVLVNSIAGPDDNIILKINIEDMSVVHLGAIKTKLDNTQLEKIGNPDILFIPVGNGEKYLSVKDAVDLVTEIEPRIIMPIGYKCDTDPEAKPVADFIKEMGIKPETEEKKIIIKQKDLPQDETKMIIIQK